MPAKTKGSCESGTAQCCSCRQVIRAYYQIALHARQLAHIEPWLYWCSAVMQISAPLSAAPAAGLARPTWRAPHVRANRQRLPQLRQPVTCRAGAAKATKQKAYICKDCGWIYEGRAAFEELPSSYKCPVCQAPKRRFAPYKKPVGAKANTKAAMHERYEKLESGGLEGGASTAIVAAAAGAVGLAALYFVLNSQY